MVALFSWVCVDGSLKERNDLELVGQGARAHWWSSAWRWENVDAGSETFLNSNDEGESDETSSMEESGLTRRLREVTVVGCVLAMSLLKQR